MSFRSIIETQCFTFWVGEDQTPIEIHRGAVTSVLPVLAAMIGCGMKESTDRVAVLEDVDPDTFKLFAEFAYTSLYRLPDKTLRSPFTCYCVNCGTFSCDREGSAFPYCTMAYLNTVDLDRTPGHRYCIDCAKEHERPTSTIRCDSCLEDQRKEQMRQPVSQYRAASAEEAFLALQYPVAGLSHAVYGQHLRNVLPRLDLSDQVSVHVKLFVFADTYAIEGLKRLCLHLLHRDLGELELNTGNIEEVVEMFRFAYENTVRGTEKTYGVGEELRKLVIGYGGWRAGELSSYEMFNDLIADGGDLAVDFMRVLMEQLQSG